MTMDFHRILNFHLFDTLQSMWWTNDARVHDLFVNLLSTILFLKLFTSRMAFTHNYNCIQHEASAQITWIIYYYFWVDTFVYNSSRSFSSKIFRCRVLLLMSKIIARNSFGSSSSTWFCTSLKLHNTWHSSAA